MNDRESLKSLIRTEPTLLDTLASLEVELSTAKTQFDAISSRVLEIHKALSKIDSARKQLAGAQADIKGESASHSKPTDKPNSKE